MAGDAKPLALVVGVTVRRGHEGQGFDYDYFALKNVQTGKFVVNAGAEGVVEVDSAEEAATHATEQDAAKFGEELGFKVLAGEKRIRPHHIAFGLPTSEAVHVFVRELVSRGAEVISKDEARPKYFLLLNPRDSTLLEVFWERSGHANYHVDYTVQDLDGPRAVHGGNIRDYNVPNMLFAVIPEMPEMEGVSVELAFAVRE